jgi:hypothetical protein
MSVIASVIVPEPAASGSQTLKTAEKRPRAEAALLEGVGESSKDLARRRQFALGTPCLPAKFKALG